MNLFRTTADLISFYIDCRSRTTHLVYKQTSPLGLFKKNSEHTTRSMYTSRSRTRDSHQNLGRDNSKQNFGLLAGTAAGETITVIKIETTC